jgi:hypothetical protein
MEVAPHSPNVTEHSSTELMKTDLPPKRPLEDDSITSLTMNSAEHEIIIDSKDQPSECYVEHEHIQAVSRVPGTFS